MSYSNSTIGLSAIQEQLEKEDYESLSEKYAVTTFNITPELWQEMRTFSTDSRPRFLYVITHHNPDGSLNMGYSGKKTADILAQANTYTGSSSDSLFSKKRILSHRSEYQMHVVGFCRSKEELGASEDALNQYMKRFYKAKWANKHLANGKNSTENLIWVNKDGEGRNVRPEELDTYLNDGWLKGGLSKGLISIVKDGEMRRVKPEELGTYLNDGWIKGSLSKGLIWVNKDGVGKMVNPEELDSYLNDGWVEGSLNKDKICIIKDGEGKMVRLEELDTYLTDGWVEGHLNKGLIRVNKNGVEERVRFEDLDTYLNEGWVKGGKSYYKVLIDKEGNEHEVYNTEVLGKLKEGYRFTQKSIDICNKNGKYKTHYFERGLRYKYDREKQHLKLIRLLESGDWQLGSVWEEPMLVGEPVVAEIEEPVVAVKYDFVALMSMVASL
jgi:hypothetical protein